jgi:hypothetical protein
MKDNWVGVGSLKVISSSRISSLNVREAVAGVPETSAVIVTVVKGVTVSGVPTISTVFADTLERLRPVAERPEALKLIGFPDAANAWN